MAEVPEYGVDYDLARWSDGSRDGSGHLVWHETLPSNLEWHHVRYVTLDFNPQGEPDYRNAIIPIDRPLDPYGSIDLYGPDEPYYDLDDLAADMMDRYGLAY